MQVVDVCARGNQHVTVACHMVLGKFQFIYGYNVSPQSACLKLSNKFSLF
jgi:hypothetical protein